MDRISWEGCEGKTLLQRYQGSGSLEAKYKCISVCARTCTHTYGTDRQGASMRAFQNEETAGKNCTCELGTSEGQKETHVAGRGDGGGNR